jgi:hypothetical protein
VHFSLRYDFGMFGKVTSPYRVPTRRDDPADCQRVLDGYYATAGASRGQLQLARNPTTVVVLAKGCARQTGEVAVPPAVPVPADRQLAELRQFALCTPGSQKMFPLLRRLYPALRRLREY